MGAGPTTVVKSQPHSIHIKQLGAKNELDHVPLLLSRCLHRLKTRHGGSTDTGVVAGKNVFSTAQHSHIIFYPIKVANRFYNGCFSSHELISFRFDVTSVFDVLFQMISFLICIFITNGKT